MGYEKNSPRYSDGRHKKRPPRTGYRVANQKYSNQKKRYRRRLLILRAGVIILLILIAVVSGLVIKGRGETKWRVDGGGIQEKRPPIDVELLTPNEYSRPQTPLEKVNGIVIHYTANPGTDAINNRNYFEGLKDSHLTYASSHFVVGLDGQIVQCIPTSEIAYASNERNDDTISIEVCHPDESGKFNKATYHSLVWLTGWLCIYLDVNPENIIRHYDVTGKICPKYYVEHEDKWEDFKSDVDSWIKSNR